jgi:hypothetical protein
MATTQELAELRLNTKQPLNEEPYTDDFMMGMIDEYGVDGASGKIWRAKAAAVSNLVDVSEGGSSRKMSQVFEQYTKNAIGFEASDVVDEGDSSYRAPRSRKATRV